MAPDGHHEDPCNVLTISFKALQRSRQTLEDFSKTYFPYIGLKLPDDLLKYLDVLVWVEATIYQLDEDNEQLTGHGGQSTVAATAGLDCIRAVLRRERLLDDRVQHEIAQGLRYWELEQHICAALLAAPRPLQAPAAQLTYELVLECHSAKSFDYRVLCLLLFRLSGRPHDERLLAFLRLDEMLVDISDDLCDYEDDVVANSFNIFRCYIHLYGREAELKLVERIGALESQHAKLLAGLPEESQRHYWSRHQEACDGQGADRWVFPPPIYDEEEYRRRVKAEEAAAAAAAETGAAAAGGQLG
ncbi:hypothetical protein CHLRE_17g719050v5 [Chlamydomonas reinhardtii]|uniref:Uncharacterized protein n=1 Tax=Chlamydomonas reinhardtii TaxID=3055 RepID=A0A2K3CQ58_CHLRE|nr:uncharacterized protein CHLRE_17g719050v5 [Chlamydomonas reinhardtii]PNW70419.1 hypothetical protein CHLRE_17g719050v5 [Chlamydomonas reinhardtii]